MSVTKNQLAELVVDIKHGGDDPPDTKFHPKIIWKIAEFARNSLIEDAFDRGAKTNTDDINGDFVTTYKNIDVQFDKDREEYFSVLPAAIVSLKDDRGLRQVSAMKDQRMIFTRIANGQKFVFSGLESELVNPYPQVYIEENKLFYINKPTAIEKVLIKMISSISDLDPNTPIPIPANVEDLMLERILKRMDEQNVEEQDKTNDSNPDV